MAAPPKWEPEAYTQHVVKTAIEMYETEGLSSTVAYYNTVESIDGQWYVFIFNEEDTLLAHAADPAIVGRHASGVVSPNGYPSGQALVAVADEDGSWFSYTFANPASGVVEAKHSWVVEHDGLVFGSGWYERGPRRSDGPGYTQAFVERAMNLYDAVGLEGTVTYYNTVESIDGQWYMFIFDEDDTILSHAAIPDVVGLHASESLGPQAYPAGAAVAAVGDEDGEWFSYAYVNPDSGAVEVKHSWIVRYDGLTFGSGWYEAGPSRADAPAYTKAFVDRAINLYDAIGREATVEYYKSAESVDGQWYVFIVDGDGYTIAHHNPVFLGRDPALRIDATGHFYGDDLRSATASGRWVVLRAPEPGDGR